MLKYLLIIALVLSVAVAFGADHRSFIRFHVYGNGETFRAYIDNIPLSGVWDIDATPDMGCIAGTHTAKVRVYSNSAGTILLWSNYLSNVVVPYMDLVHCHFTQTSGGL